jgi:phosphoglycolate phosphatase-like HAD superfamily hydrolase
VVRTEPRGAAAILFDIDGTLISTGGASDRAWRRAFAELHGIEVNVGDYTGKGVTDPVVGVTSFRGAIGREPTPEEMVRLMALRLRYLPEEVASSPNYRVLPGVERLLDRLVDEGRLLGLITGNVEAAAHIKLARANLNHCFSFGGYGSDAPERVDVARAALDRAELVAGGNLDRDRCVAVGDTPVDVDAAHGAGIRIISVATGEYGVEELRAAGADHVLATLAEPLPLAGFSA